MSSVNDQSKRSSADLLVESDAPTSKDDFSQEIKSSIAETEQIIDNLGVDQDPIKQKSWLRSRELIESFQPVPWFIWRLSNFVFSNPESNQRITEGLVFGLRRLIFAAASDPVLGAGEKINRVRKALQVLPGDVVAAVSVIHAISRRIQSHDHERIWRPILDDALLRCRIGCALGELSPTFGRGRGMLSGFAGRAGLVVLISSGTLEQARKSLELLATGTDTSKVGLEVYGCDPIQVSAMLLSASGCGRDAAFGTVSYSLFDPKNPSEIEPQVAQEQFNWLAAFAIIENIRTNKPGDIPEVFWEALSFSPEKRETLLENSKLIVRRGHGWQWLG